MPYCPSCHSYFKTERGVKNHLSHKFSFCAGYLDQLLKDDALSGMTEAEAQRNLGVPLSLYQSPFHTQSEDKGNDIHMDFVMDNNIQLDNEDDSTESLLDHMHVDSVASQDFFSINYPGASAIYEKSSIFYEYIYEEGQHIKEKKQYFLPIFKP